MSNLLPPRTGACLTLLIFLVMKNTPVYAQVPVIDSVVAASGSVGQFGKFECAVYLKAAVTNPYDYEEISVQAIFTGPNGENTTVDGFFMQNFTLNTTTGALAQADAGQFRVRFCPQTEGLWTYTVQVTLASGSAVSAPQQFECLPTAGKGFVRRFNNRYFRFDNGEQYIPIGQNVCWQNGNVYLDYKNWLGDMAANGANFFRLWMAHWGLGIEWKNNSSGFSGLKKYKQSAAFYLDWMLDYCAVNNLYMMLCINHHGQYSTTVNPNWNENPYNAAFGGPLNLPQEFFSNSTAKALHKNRLRYIVARWGYSTQVQCWELFNEVDLTENFDANAGHVVNWHGEMADYLKSIDPYQHLVSTSGSRPGAFDDIWELGSIDFTQEHLYQAAANIDVPIAETARQLAINFNKPALVAEFGLSGSGTQTAADDPEGIHLHNGLWAGLFSGSAGSAMTWWWDNYVEPKNLYHHFAPLAAVANQVPFVGGNFQPVAAGVSGGPASDAVFSPAAGWATPTAAQFNVDASGNLTPGITELGQFLYGASWNSQYRNPPQFAVTFPAASKFRVRTGANTSQAPKMVISLDGQIKINQNAQTSTNYTIDVPAGAHTIMVDNSGTDWIEIAEYVFEKIGGAADAYVLQSAGREKTAGWIHHKQYNWLQLKNSGTPAPIDGVVVTVPGMEPGPYVVNWWDCSSGMILQTTPANANAAGQLALGCPQIAWDLAFTAQADVTGVATALAEDATGETFFPSPVPGNGIFHWAAEQVEPGEWTARFFNTQGQQVKEQQVDVAGDAPVALSAAGLPPGLVFITLENGLTVRRGKVLVGF